MFVKVEDCVLSDEKTTSALGVDGFTTEDLLVKRLNSGNNKLEVMIDGIIPGT